MAITCGPDCPADVAQLAVAFSRCAENHEVEAVIGAATNVLMMAITMSAQARNVGDAAFQKFARDMATQMGDHVFAGAIANRNRRRQPGDVEVKAN